ncbi:MAG: cytochrome c biogenesis protein CcsA, partial [Opitutaceae bacterium]|nr:cytochrome c biogenesis protein CcsA [Opitutaceae bacterium]
RQGVANPTGVALTFAEKLTYIFKHTRPDGKPPLRLEPTAWLLDVFFRPALADTYQTFEIVHPEVLALFNLTVADGEDKKRFSFNQLEKGIPELERQAQLASPVEAAARTPFQRGIVQLYGKVRHYFELKHTLIMPGSQDFLGELLRFQQALPAGVAAVRAQQAGQPYDVNAFKAMMELGPRYDFMGGATTLLAIPPAATNSEPAAWQSTGNSILETFQTGSVNPTALAYAGLAHAWQRQQAEPFNKIIELYGAELAKRLPAAVGKVAAETRFNSVEPFYKSLQLYLLALLLALVSWLKWPDTLGRAAFWLVLLAFVTTTAGIATRMWLEGRPPVTNLYSSALFVGWGAVGLCLILEAIYKNAVGSVAAGLIGFATLIIAHNLSLSGDTLEMMRAVLDSNFWLATHVVVVATGYSATCLAGFLALIYVVRGVFTRSLDNATADALSRMVYGIVCFATLFSFTGTVLGGIWADQSWGRFWGWDPKENGALMIVIWNAMILHARWGGLIRQRGLMSMAIFGNVIFSWSWFGTNMLGVGLHSYGFTDAAFVSLLVFVTSQLAFIALASLPLKHWRSFRSA